MIETKRFLRRTQSKLTKTTERSQLCKLLTKLTNSASSHLAIATATNRRLFNLTQEDF